MNLKMAGCFLDLRFRLFIICTRKRDQQISQADAAILELWTNHRPTLEKHFVLIRQNAETMQPGEYRALSGPSS